MPNLKRKATVDPMTEPLPRVVQVISDDITLTFTLDRLDDRAYWVARAQGYGSFPIPLPADGDESTPFFMAATEHILRELGA